MPRVRSPERDRAFALYEESGGTLENRRIAEVLGISEKTVGGWKCKDKWDEKLNGVLQSTERSTPKHKGGQPGNQNAVGHGPPEGNINAVKHGAYQSLYAQFLPEEEKELYEQMPGDADLEEEIRLLRLKLTRLLTREHDFFYDGFGVRHEKDISEEDRETGIQACMKQLEKMVRTQEANRVQREKSDREAQQMQERMQREQAKLQIEQAKLELERKRTKLLEQRQSGGEFEEDLSELDEMIYGDS